MIESVEQEAGSPSLPTSKRELKAPKPGRKAPGPRRKEPPPEIDTRERLGRPGKPPRLLSEEEEERLLREMESEEAALPPPPPRAPRSGPPLPLPRPPHFDCSESPIEFFKYWKALSREELDRSLVYVYRNWPVWNPAQLLTDEERERVDRRELRLITNIGKFSEPWEPRAWEHEIFHRFGTGDYHFKLNDVLLKKTVCMVSIKGLRDFENHPPNLKAEAVVMSDPANASYLEKMRLMGKVFPGDPGYRGEDTMGSETVQNLTGTVERLASRLADAGRQTTPSAQSHADLKAVESVAEGAKQGMKIMGDAIAAAESSRMKAQDPKEYLRDTIEMAKLLTPAAPPPDNTSNQIITMMDRMMVMQADYSRMMMEDLKARLTYTERTLQEVIAKATAPPAAATGPNGAPVVNGTAPRSMLDDLDKLVSLRGKMDDLFGGGGGSNGAPAWAPYAIQGLTLLVTGATNFAHNLAVAKTGVGAAIAPPTMPTMEAQEEEPNPGTGGPEQMNVLQFAQRLHRPLVNALEQGIPGHQFAAQMILHEGAMSYGYLSGLGKDGVLNLLQMYMPIWQDVIKVPQVFDAFLDDFLRTDEAYALAEELKATAMDAQDMGAPAAAQGRPPMPPPPPPRPFASPRQAAPPPPPPPPAPAAAPAPPPRPMAPGPGEQRRKVKGPGGELIEVIAPRPEHHTHKAPTVNPPPGPPVS